MISNDGSVKRFLSTIYMILLYDATNPEIEVSHYKDDIQP